MVYVDDVIIGKELQSNNQKVTVGNSTDDPITSFSTDANTFTMGVDNSVSDTFAISAASSTVNATSASITISTGSRVGINGQAAAPATFQINSTTGCLVLPRMTTTQRDAISMTGASGALIFNITTNKLNIYSGSGWEVVTSA